ncbi:hypothetical protein RB594_008524 [Gaeumannomyces avenae]
MRLYIAKLAVLAWAAATLQPAVAFWVLNCGNPVVVDRVDPITSPGRVPSGHVHTVMGGDAFSSAMTYEDALNSSCTSCAITADLSNYWAPALYFRHQDGSFSSVPNSGGMLVYYLQREDERDPQYEKGIAAFPPGFRMMAGDPWARRLVVDVDDKEAQATLRARAISFACLGLPPGDHGLTSFLPNRKCPAGLRVQVSFPSCWDGVGLDSAGHRDHVAYPSDMDNGVCPPSHPRRLMYLFYEIVYRADAFDDEWGPEGSDQPFVFSHGDQTGFGYHGDFLNGWDTKVLQDAIDGCRGDIRGAEDCPALRDHVQPVAKMNRCTKQQEYKEKVLGESLPSLPGCNPVQTEHPASQRTCDTPSNGTRAVPGGESQSSANGRETPLLDRLVRRLGGLGRWRLPS